MTLTDTIRLITQTKEPDADGYPTITEASIKVKCDSGVGVTRSEFYDACKAGIQLSAAFELWACDYAGQILLEHNGKRYRVERAFPIEREIVQLNCSEVTR